MATNDNKEVDEIEEVEEIEETKDEFENDTTDWRALALKNQGIAKRYQTKLQKKLEAEKLAAKKAEEAKEKQPQDKKEDKKDFDYAEKAYLKAMGIEKDEFPFVLEAMQSTGKSLDEMLDSKYFQSELKEKREEKASQDAIPSGSKRSGGSARDSVEYWLAKGELPPTDQRELRQQVVNAKLKAESAKNKFTDRPVV